MNQEKKISSELKRISKLTINAQQIGVAAIIAEEFRKRGISSVLVGGAAVAFYTMEGYVTKDIDMILAGDTKTDIEEVMIILGFKRTSTYRHFEHELYKFVVEFPPGPVQVGNKVIEKVNEIDLGRRKVKIISIEDIIMDRIIAGVEWRDENSIAQAKLLWQFNQSEIDTTYLKEFAKKEGYEKELKGVMC